MNIREIKLSELKPYENNPRINENAVDKVAESIKQFGFKVPIVIDKNNVIVAGHTRFLASKKLNLETVPVIIADDLTDEQIKAFRLADNKTAEFSEWDFEKLKQEFFEIENLFTGFDDWEIEHLLNEIDDSKINDFFTPTEEKKKEPKIITCPHCGERFEIE